MAEKYFGEIYAIPGTTETYVWGGVPNYANVYRRAVMPEGGKVTKIRFAVHRYQSTDNPIVWVIIRDRATGAIIAQSAAKTTWSGYFTNPSFTEFNYTYHDFILPATYIPAGTELWIGFSRDSNDANRRTVLMYKQPYAGEIVDYNDASQDTPPAIFTPTAQLVDKYVPFRVFYESGGEMKVWDGSANVPKPVKVWNGSAWVQKVVKVWNGSIWKESNS